VAEEDRDQAFAAIVLELGLSTRANVEKALAARASGDGRALGKILLASGWIDEAGYLRALDAGRARAALGAAPAADAKTKPTGRKAWALRQQPVEDPNAPNPERLDLEKRRRAARAAVQKGALVAETAANAPFVKKLLGARLGRTQIERLVTKGPMSLTFHGRLDDGQLVTVKILRADMVENTRAIARFERQNAALARVDHPAVLRVLDHGVLADGAEPSVHWLSVEREERETTLAERLELEHTLAPASAAALGAEVANGLAAAHRAGVIHRDVRPETIFLSASGAVRVGDFGLARDEEAQDQITFKGQILGAAEYTAPELSAGPATPAADVYSLGVLLYRVLVGELPYASKSVVRLLQLHATAPIPWAHLAGTAANKTVPRPFSALLRELMAKKPEERPAMEAVARSLADPGLLEPGPEDACAGCGAATTGPRDGAAVSICPSCLAEVSGRRRCAGCLEPLRDDAIPYSGRAYCPRCAEQVRIVCTGCGAALLLSSVKAARGGGPLVCDTCRRARSGPGGRSQGGRS
jgi:hypothetical protein